MIRRTISAALLMGLACSAAVAAQFNSPTYNEAADLAGGKSPNAAYDGNVARGSVRGEVDGALSNGGLTVPKTAPNAAAAHDVLRPAVVPAPDTESKEGFFTFSKRSLLMGGAGASLGAGVGWWFGGLLGAAIGAVAGFAIGFVMSKLLH